MCNRVMLFVNGVQLVVVLGLHVLFLYLGNSLCRKHNLPFLQKSERAITRTTNPRNNQNNTTKKELNLSGACDRHEIAIEGPGTC